MSEPTPAPFVPRPAEYYIKARRALIKLASSAKEDRKEVLERAASGFRNVAILKWARLMRRLTEQTPTAFDEEFYAKAKPVFDAAIVKLDVLDKREVVVELVGFLAYTLNMKREKIVLTKPYVLRFAEEQDLPERLAPNVVRFPRPAPPWSSASVV